jgi:hypothetical protein
MKRKSIKINRTDRGEPVNEHSWPRNTVKHVECRKRDLVIRITNWLDDVEEPAFDVECYIGGVYDWNESKTFSTENHTPRPRSNAEARLEAIEFAQKQIAKHTQRP